MVTDIDLISDGLLQGFTQLFTGVVTILGTLLFMLTINVKIALVVVLITPLSLFVASFIARRSHKMFREQSAVRGEMTGYVEELIGNRRWSRPSLTRIGRRLPSRRSTAGFTTAV